MMNKSESIKEISIALSKFQGEVTNPSNTATNPFFQSKYAPLETVLNTVRPILSKHGLSIMQIPSSEGDYVTITTMLVHSSGEWIESEPLSLKMDKVTAQGAGSAITYARRYAVSAMLGISSEDDDDGNNAEPKKEATVNTGSRGSSNLSEGQIKRLYAIGYSKGLDVTKINNQVMSKYKKRVGELSRGEYDTVCDGYEKMEGK